MYIYLMPDSSCPAKAVIAGPGAAPRTFRAVALAAGAPGDFRPVFPVIRDESAPPLTCRDVLDYLGGWSNATALESLRAWRVCGVPVEVPPGLGLNWQLCVTYPYYVPDSDRGEGTGAERLVWALTQLDLGPNRADFLVLVDHVLFNTPRAYILGTADLARRVVGVIGKLDGYGYLSNRTASAGSSPEERKKQLERYWDWAAGPERLLDYLGIVQALDVA